MNETQKYRDRGFVAAIALAFSCGLAAIWWQRALAYDGADWFFKILDTHWFALDPDFQRYGNYLLQAPAVAVLNLFPAVHPSIPLRLLDLAYQIHPAVSLLACWMLLVSQDRRELFIFPLLSWAMATLLTQTFAVGQAPETLSVLWPLFFLLTLDDLASRRNWLFALGLVLLLPFTYELALIPMPLLGFIAWTRGRSAASEQLRWRWRALLGALLAGLVWILYVVLIYSTPGARSTFHSSLRILNLVQTPLVRYSALSIPVLAVSLQWGSDKRWIRVLQVAWLVFGFWAIGETLSSEERVALMPYHHRLIVIPIGTGLAALAWRYGARKLAPLLPIILLALVPGIAFDLATTLKWAEFRERSLRDVAAYAPCGNVPVFEGDFFFHWKWTAPAYSILIQRERELKGMVAYLVLPGNPFCSNRFVVQDFPEDLPRLFAPRTLKNGVFDYSIVLPATAGELTGRAGLALELRSQEKDCVQGTLAACRMILEHSAEIERYHLTRFLERALKVLCLAKPGDPASCVSLGRFASAERRRELRPRCEAGESLACSELEGFEKLSSSR